MIASTRDEILRTVAEAVPVRVSADDFHQVQALRYRLGRDSPEGFWLDAYDYPRLRADVLDPFGPDGSRRYRPRARPAIRRGAPPTLAHRTARVGAAPRRVAVTAARMAVRDGTSPDPGDPSMRRYVEAQHIYDRSAQPRERASMVIDNSKVGAPVWFAPLFGEVPIR